MNAKLVLAVFALLVLSSRHTIMENSNPYDYDGGYTQTKNEKGETIHVRERPVQAYVPPPINYPVIPIYPANPVYPVAPVFTGPSAPLSRPSDGSSSADLDSSEGKSGHAFLEFARTNGNSHLGFHFGGLASVFTYEGNSALCRRWRLLRRYKEMYTGIY